MSVYVDDSKNPFGTMIMCHMTADTHGELIQMTRRIGVQAKWIQKAGEWSEHFDIALSKRKLAVAAGAIEVTKRQMIEKLQAKRTAMLHSGRSRQD